MKNKPLYSIKKLLKKVAASIHYAPHKRNFNGAKKFIEVLKSNPSRHKIEEAIDIVKYNVPELTRIMTETLSDRFNNRQNYRKRIQRLLFHPLAATNDTIHNKQVNKLMLEGLKTMEGSKDPFHDVSHIYRCIRLAKLYYGIYKLQDTKLDWGKLVTAIVYHDIARSDDLGILNKGGIYKLIQKIPFVLDIDLVRNIMDDAERSAETLNKMVLNYKLPQNFLPDVIYGILGTSPKADKQKLNNLYFKIVCDVDKLDLCTIGRFQAGLENVVQHKMATMKYFNRCNYLVSWSYYKFRNALHLKISKPIFDFYAEHLDKFASKFYPQDAEVLSNK